MRFVSHIHTYSLPAIYRLPIVNVYYYGCEEGPPLIFFNHMLSHKNDLVSRPYEIATIIISYVGLTNLASNFAKFWSMTYPFWTTLHKKTRSAQIKQQQQQNSKKDQEDSKRTARKSKNNNRTTFDRFSTKHQHCQLTWTTRGGQC